MMNQRHRGELRQTCRWILWVVLGMFVVGAVLSFTGNEAFGGFLFLLCLLIGAGPMFYLTHQRFNDSLGSNSHPSDPNEALDDTTQE